MKISRIDRLICEQENIGVITREKIREIQLDKLNRLLGREKDRQGFYKDLPERISALEELSALPFTTDEDLAAYAPSMLLCSQSEIQRVISDATSGTSGRQKRVFYTLNDCENTIKLYMAGLGEFIFPGSKTMVCMPFSGPYGLGELISEAIRRLGASPLKIGVGLDYSALNEVIRSESPDTYVGMPVPLLSMLRLFGRQSLRRALVSGDACPTSVVRGIEDILGTKLFPHYGSREMGMAGAICCHAHEGMHLREHMIIAEIIDENDNVLPAGEFGQLVITTIGMEAMPLVRYKTGDYTRLLPGPCPCGSEVLRLDTVRRGREVDSMERFDDFLFADAVLVDYSISRLDGVYHIKLISIGCPGIKEKLRTVFGDNCRVEILPPSLRDKPLYIGKRTIQGF